MRVLGIDPGLTRCGIGIVDSTGPQKLEMVGVGVIQTDIEAPLEFRLLELEKAVVEGAGATGFAAVLQGLLPELKGKKVVIPVCGGNIDVI